MVKLYQTLSKSLAKLKVYTFSQNQNEFRQATLLISHNFKAPFDDGPEDSIILSHV